MSRSTSPTVFRVSDAGLDPIESAALLLREVFEFKNREAAKILDLSESVFRHKLAAARAFMIETYDGLCSLVGKRGMCHQCSELCDACPTDARGPAVVNLGSGDQDSDELLEQRLKLVRRADVNSGSTHQLHDEMLRMIAEHLH